MQGEKWLNWLHSILGRFSTDFRKLLSSTGWVLERYEVNICCLNSGWGSFSKKASLKAVYVQCRPDSPQENRSMGLGPVCWLAPHWFSKSEAGLYSPLPWGSVHYNFSIMTSINFTCCLFPSQINLVTWDLLGHVAQASGLIASWSGQPAGTFLL